MVQKLRPFYWRSRFCLLMELHWEGSVPAACAAGCFNMRKAKLTDPPGNGEVKTINHIYNCAVFHLTLTLSHGLGTWQQGHKQTNTRPSQEARWVKSFNTKCQPFQLPLTTILDNCLEWQSQVSRLLVQFRVHTDLTTRQGWQTEF